jgi:hypothetical protein
VGAGVVTVSWADSGRGALGFTVDIDDGGNFAGGFWHRTGIPSGTTTTTAPGGFVAYNGATGPLSLGAGGTFQTRVYFPATGEQSPVTTFTAPKVQGVIGFTLGFAVRGQQSWWAQIPLLAPYDASEQSWWDGTVADAVYSNVDFVAPVTRGCSSTGGAPVGNGDPHALTGLVSSLAQYPVTNKLKVALFVDSGGAFTIQKNLDKYGTYSTSPPFDWADPTGAGDGGWKYFLDQDITPFYDTVPVQDLYLYNGQPVIYFWSVANGCGYKNQQGNLAPFLRAVKASVQAQIGMTPFIVVDQSWVQLDTTITPAEADGVDNWFDPTVSAYTINNWNDLVFGVAVPGFMDNPMSTLQRNLPRNAGQTLTNALTQIQAAGTNLTLLEGLTDVEESAGYYRSDDPDWAGNPTLYLDIVSSFTTP